MTKFSWEVLNTFVEIDDLDKDSLADEIALKVLEVDEVTEDYIDIDVTPNRAHDCLAHIGIAREIATIKNKPFKDLQLDNLKLPSVEKIVAGQFSNEVRRFVTVEIHGVKFNESPQWLQDRLSDLGQKSINVIVDLTNYVMFETGQPLHAYDLNLLPSGDLGVRSANDSETVELLDSKTYELSAKNLVIVDSNDRSLGLAGVKGGSTTQISDSTANILLESANFDPVTIRKSGGFLGIRTDALKRFENEPSAVFSEIAASRFCELLLLEQPNAKIITIKDYYPNEANGAEAVLVNHESLESKLGIKIDPQVIKTICIKQNISLDEVSGGYELTAPYWRLDLNIFEDYVEEFGRLIGYDSISEVQLPTLETKASPYDLYSKLRSTLVDLGLYEVQTYSLVKKGNFETLKPLASDKGALRRDISTQLAESLVFNNRNAELFGSNQVGIFEIGSTFPKSGEVKHLAIAVSGKQKVTNKLLEEIKSALAEINKDLVSEWQAIQVEGGATVEINISDIKVEKFMDLPKSSTAKFQAFSNQPFTTRDISVWVGEGGSREDLEKLISENAGENLLSYRMVDEFEKDGRQSFAYRLVFQNPARTLTDEEVNKTMETIYSGLKDNYELR